MQPKKRKGLVKERENGVGDALISPRQEDNVQSCWEREEVGGEVHGIGRPLDSGLRLEKGGV